MHKKIKQVLLLLSCALVLPPPVMADGPANSLNSATNYLLSKQNASDGSWGTTDDMKYVQTAEAVVALGAANQLNAQYFAGLAWLNNHAPANLDFAARRALATGIVGNLVNADLLAISRAQNTAAAGNNGWGLSDSYTGSPLDTALSLIALNAPGNSAQSNAANVAKAVTYLTNAQLTAANEKGWALGKATVSDPVSTALVIQALIPFKASNPAAAAAISNGLQTLENKVTTSAPLAHIALAYIAHAKNDAASPQAASLLAAMQAQQLADGSFNSDLYATSLAIRAFAVSMGKDIEAQKQVVNMPDDNLRKAINAELGRNAMDALNVGQLQQLTGLSAQGMGIVDLTGLQYASNLLVLDVSNNQINSFDPIKNLPLNNLTVAGNPGASQPGDGQSGDVPLPPWAMLLLALLFMHVLSRQANRHAKRTAGY